MNLRSIDVLHNFYVPQFRAKMDLGPGYDNLFLVRLQPEQEHLIFFAQNCVVMGHYAMRGTVVVDDKTAFNKWLQKQETFATLYPKGCSRGKTSSRHVCKGPSEIKTVFSSSVTNTK